jgi:hypothetical protein
MEFYRRLITYFLLRNSKKNTKTKAVRNLPNMSSMEN